MGCDTRTSIPSPTIASESPTRIMSIWAWSAAKPEGKSWAVIMAMGTLFACIVRRVLMVTFFLGGVALGDTGE